MENNIKASCRAARNVYGAGGEHYHFAMARAQFGDDAVLAAMRRQSQAEAGGSFADAALVAAVEFRLMDTLPSGQERFKQLRAQLQEEAQAARQGAALVAA